MIAAAQGLVRNSSLSYRVVMFASGSRGNSLLVAGPRSRVLIDMGLTQRRIVADLAREQLTPKDLDAVFLTHTHHDHVGDAALKFCWRHQVPIVGPAENLTVLRRRFRPVVERLDRAGLYRTLPPAGHHVSGLDIRAFEVPHDADGITLGYHLTLGRGNGAEPLRVAVATDLGEAPPEVLGALASANVLVLEANHDPEMLRRSGRPAYLIDRIRGADGHLSNSQTAAAVAEIVAHQKPGFMSHLVLAHLSQECNTPELAQAAVRPVLAALGSRAPRLLTAAQDQHLVVLSGK